MCRVYVARVVHTEHDNAVTSIVQVTLHYVVHILEKIGYVPSKIMKKKKRKKN